MEPIVLRCGGVAVVIDPTPPVPAILHWGPEPGPLSPGLGALTGRPIPPASLDRTAAPSIVRVDPADAGRPGLVAWRPDAGASPAAAHPRFDRGNVTVRDGAVDFTSRADGIELRGTIELQDTLAVSVLVANTGATPLALHRLAVTLPLPADADEALWFEGHWCAETHPRREPWVAGSQVLDNRRGRTSHDRPPLAFVGPRGFGEHRGWVHGMHLAWSGNAEVVLEARTDGTRVAHLAELLDPGEVILVPGEAYEAPVVHGVAGEGLSAASARFHAEARRHLRPRPRPVLINTWEAVYFDHDADTLRALAGRAAAVGVERFVLDDGWFGGRRDDRAGLGDWWVSPEAHPEGLGPLIDHVRDLGMDFGIWVEPEMANPDSDLLRTHPDWVLGDATVTGRNQLVLDLSIGACWQHLHDALDALLADHDIAFVKWDMNRDLAGAGPHTQVRALYGLLDALRARHPDVEFESCASGGGRADLGILARVDRVWTSDCNDALERQRIQRGASHLLPLEVLGAHIGPTRAHTTGRSQRLAFRAATALFGHLGIEWNLLEAEPRHLEALSWWIAQHKRLRPLLHTGRLERLDHPDPAVAAQVVVSPERDEAILSVAQLTASRWSVPPRLRIQGLDPARTYRLTHLAAPGEVLGLGSRAAWLDETVEATGQMLATIGLQVPVLLPESALLVELTTA